MAAPKIATGLLGFATLVLDSALRVARVGKTSERSRRKVVDGERERNRETGSPLGGGARAIYRPPATRSAGPTEWENISGSRWLAAGPRGSEVPGPAHQREGLCGRGAERMNGEGAR